VTFGIRLKLPVLTSTPSVVWGIDVSAFQHPNGAAIDWAQVGLAGVKQAYIQASQGTGVLNPYFADDVAGARAAAIPVGAYHLCYPALNTPAAEVAYFRTAIAGVTLDLPAMLDDETKLDKAWVLTWFALWGDPKALHYSDASYLAALGNLGYRQWTARPGATGLYPGDYATQYASAPVPGIVGNVDLDYFDPAPKPKEEEMLMLFVAKITAGPNAGNTAYFVSNGMRFRWVQTPTQLGDIGLTGAVFNGGAAVETWAAGATVADVGAFGNPDDPVTAAMLGLPYPAQPIASGGLTTAQDAELTALSASMGRIEAALKGA